MARISKVDLCLICENAPCSCNSKAKSPTRSTRTNSAPKKSAHELMKAQAAMTPEPSVVSELEEQAVVAYTESSDQEEFREAVIALAPLLHPDELEKYRAIASNPDRRFLSERIADWKKRRDDAQLPTKA